MTERPDTTAAGGTDATTEFRITPPQRRHLLIAVVVALGAAVVAGFIASSAKSAGAAEVAAASGLCGLILLYSYLAYAVARTDFGPTGISGRNLTGPYAYRWDQIGNVARRAYTARGVTTYTIILTTTDGDRIRLGAPVAGGIMGDPEFAGKYAQIRGAWQAATGRTGPQADTRSIWTRGLILLTAGMSLQIIAAVVIATIVSVYGPAFAAHEGKGTPGTFQSELRNCSQPGCTWFGQFTAQGNANYATLAPGGPFISQAYVNVRAVDTGAKDTVYPAGGGTAWKTPAAGLVVASSLVLVLLAIELTVLLRLHVRRRARARCAQETPAG